MNSDDSIIALGGSSTDSPSVYKAKLEALVSKAPTDIKPDLQVLAQIDERIVDGDTSAQAQFTQPDVVAHLKHVVTWLEASCPGSVCGTGSGSH